VAWESRSAFLYPRMQIVRQKFGGEEILSYFCGEKGEKVMTTLQLNAELYRAMGVIADDEGLMRKALKYIKKLAVKKREQDETLIPKGEYLESLERGEEEFRQGKTFAMLPGESFSDFRKRIGR